MERISIRDLHRRWKEGLEVPPAKLPFLNFPEEACPLVEGWSHVIAGKPKIGKTELILQVIMGWEDKRVLWLTEEPRSAWVLRVALMDAWMDTVPGNFMLITGCRAEEPEALLAEAKEGADVVVLDTVKLLRIRDENDNAGITRALTPWTAWGEQTTTTLIFIHHNRNAEGTYGDEVAGGHAWVANLDLFLTVKRKTGKKEDNRRQVEGIGRVYENKPFMYTFDPETRAIECMPYGGNEAEEVMKRVLEVMQEAVGPHGLTTAEVRNQLTNVSKRQTLDALTALAEEGSNGLVRVPPLSTNAKGQTIVWRMEEGKEEDNEV